MRKPAWVKLREKQLADANVTAQEFAQAWQDYHDAGLDLAYVPRRGWRLFCVPKEPMAPTTVTLWKDLGQLVHDRASIIDAYQRMRASWALVEVTDNQEIERLELAVRKAKTLAEIREIR